MRDTTTGQTRAEADAALIARARGDRAAFGELYDLYLRRVYAFCLVHSATREEAEDLTAVTFERAMSVIGRYEQRGAPFSSWLLRIAANAAVDRARRAGREPVGRESIIDDGSVAAEDTGQRGEVGAEHWVERWERAAWMRAHVAALPADQQCVVWRRFYDDRSFGEIAAELGRSEGAVKQLAQRALKALRARIDGEPA